MLRWFGHVERSSGAVRTACDILVDGRSGPWRPKMTEENDGSRLTGSSSKEHLEIRCDKDKEALFNVACLKQTT